MQSPSSVGQSVSQLWGKACIILAGETLKSRDNVMGDFESPTALATWGRGAHDVLLGFS